MKRNLCNDNYLLLSFWSPVQQSITITYILQGHKTKDGLPRKEMYLMTYCVTECFSSCHNIINSPTIAGSVSFAAALLDLVKLFQFVMYHSPGILRLTNNIAPLGKDKLHYRIRTICLAGNLSQDQV